MPFFPVRLTQQLKIQALKGSLHIFLAVPHLMVGGWTPNPTMDASSFQLWELRVSYWLVVWSIFFSRYWEESSQLTNIFRMG